MEVTGIILRFSRNSYLVPFVLSIILLILLYKWSTSHFNILNERRVPHEKPKPLIGNFGPNVLIGQASLAKHIIELHLKFKNSMVYGMYFMRFPMILIRDITLIKKVLVTDFYNFTNHQLNVSSPPHGFGNNLYIMKDEEWRAMRDILTPTFTDLNMQAIFPLINECCIEGVNYLEQQIEESPYKEELELKVIDIFSRFTNDVISSAALGIKVISFQQKENSFFNIASNVMNFHGIPVLKAALIQLMPKLMKTIGLQVLNSEKVNHLNDVVRNIIKYREQHNIARPDMIHLLTEAKKKNAEKLAQNEKCYEFSEEDVLAQCLLFFCAGFGKVRASLCSTAYELMANPSVQEKLYLEILEVQKKLNGQPLNYDILINMKYLDMVVSETLRKWPPCAITNRACSQDYDLMDDNGNTIVRLKRDDRIAIPIIGLHRDPVNYKNPSLFDPERFSEKNRKNIMPFTYLPFGSGPRNCIVHKWSTAKFNILNERKVSHVKPKPLLGSFSNMFLGKSSMAKILIELQSKFGNKKVYGAYFMRDPVIFVQDAELIRKVYMKDFHNFTNHKPAAEEMESEIRRNLYFLKDQEWREMRDILTPAVTEEKLRATYELIEECCIDGKNCLDRKINENGIQGLELKMEEIFSRFANDVTLSAILGIKVVSFRQQENSFFKIGTCVMNFSATQMLKTYLVETMPKVMKILGIKFFDAEKLKHFNSLVHSTIKYRKVHNIVRPDMIHLLTEAKQRTHFNFNDDDVVAQCLLFFCAGFGKVASSLCFTAHELMENPDVQQKLLDEIQDVQKKLNGKSLDYDTLMDMKYMDMVISESLRKWPPNAFIDRMCKQDYDLTDEDGKTVVKLKRNDGIGISIIGLHRDPKNFENPEKFIPERFSEENSKNIKPFTYLPFGVGPRLCLGSRFALVEMKAILYHILLSYKMESSTSPIANLVDVLQGYQHLPETYLLRLLPRNF